MDFDLMNKAGLSVLEIAYLLGLSRSAVNNWKRGLTSPHFLLEKQMAAFDRMIRAAVDNNVLPADCSREERKILLEKMKNLLRNKQ